jgi:hypothetical protein
VQLLAHPLLFSFSLLGRLCGYASVPIQLDRLLVPVRNQTFRPGTSTLPIHPIGIWTGSKLEEDQVYALKQNSPQRMSRVIVPLSLRSKESCGPARRELGTPLGIDQVAQIIGCSAWTVRQTLIPSGLPHFRAKPRGRLIFYEDQIIRWIEKNQGG